GRRRGGRARGRPRGVRGQAHTAASGGGAHLRDDAGREGDGGTGPDPPRLVRGRARGLLTGSGRVDARRPGAPRRPRGRRPVVRARPYALAGHAEFAGKLTRRPRAGERTYVTTLGVKGTAALALTLPVLSAAVLVACSQAPAGWTLVALAPLAVPAAAARSFARGRTRWPSAAPGAYLLLCFASYLVLGLTR